jgi:hypothetical protein
MEDKTTLGKEITDSISTAILFQSMGGTPVEMVLLPEDDYRPMFEYLEPQFKAGPYGAPLVSEKHFKEGYENFMFQGVAICLKK